MTSSPEGHIQTPEKNQLSPLFFEQYHDELVELFGLLDMPSRAAESLSDAVNMTQPWVKGDHSRPLHQFALSDEQKQGLRPLYDRLDMVQERPLPAGHYDQILVLGAIHQGNNRRAGLLRRAIETGGVEADKIVLLGGQREMYEERESVDVAKNIDEVKQAGSKDPWFENIEKGKARINWETDLIRLAGIARLGDLTLKRLYLRLGSEEPIKKYEFEWQGTPVTLLHTLAVKRNGEPRHTTEACIEDWVNTLQPEYGSKVGFIGANPHLNRMVRSATGVLHRLKRDDIQLIAAGSGAPETIGDSIYLGEIARSLYEDQCLLAAG